MTLISDVIVPQPMADYLMDAVADKNALFASGIIYSDPLLAQKLANGGKKFDMPYWGDITSTESEVPVEGVAGAVGKIGTYDITVVRQMRKKDWGAGNLASILAGSNALNAIQVKVNNYWQTEMQDILVSTIKGVTDSTDGTKISLDASADVASEPSASTIIGANHIIDVQGLLGDNVEPFGAMIIHPAVYTDMRKQGLIATIQDKDSTAMFNYYGDMRVIVDENVPILTKTYTVAGATNVYGTILLKKGSFAYGENQSGFKPVHVEADEAKGFGEQVLMTKRQFALHPAGWNYGGTPAGVAPTNAELATGASWSLMAKAKNSGFVVLYTN